MPTINIFVSFGFDKDKELQNQFYEQAKNNTQHRIKNCSLREAYPTREWEEKAKAAIRECHGVIVLIGEDTHTASGVRTEVGLARGLRKPIFRSDRKSGLMVACQTLRSRFHGDGSA